MTDEQPRRPLVSVLVCTCNRSDNVVPTIRSIQSCGYPNFELFVLDQSRGDETERAVAELCKQDGRVRYVRLDQPSKPRALNVGWQSAKGQYIFLTDDDCEVQPGWIAEMLAVFESDSRLACVFGDVDAGPCDESAGYIPTCRITRTHSIFQLSDFLTMPGWGNFGMGASLALRADALSHVGGWDPCIGPGAYFKSGDDHDVVARILALRYGVGFCSSSHTLHYGMRYWKSIGQDQTRYGFGMGAVFAKHLRTGSYYAGPTRVLGERLLNTARCLARGKGPFGLAYPRSWLRGVVAGLRHPLDARTRCFISDIPAAPPEEASRVAEVVLRSEQRSSQSGPEVAYPPNQGAHARTSES